MLLGRAAFALLTPCFKCPWRIGVDDGEFTVPVQIWYLIVIDSLSSDKRDKERNREINCQSNCGG
jgi:hypothetical protein